MQQLGSIKAEDKVKAVESIAKLYSYIPKYAEGVASEIKVTNLYKTKSSILNACAAIEKDNFELVKTELSNAEQAFLPILNNLSMEDKNQSSFNKIYILIKELQTSVNNKDKDIFYIKYKNIIQEIKNVKV